MCSLYEEVVLTINADSTEFCPLVGLQDLLAVGTYQLQESSQERHGLLQLYRLRTPEAQELDEEDMAKHARDAAWQLQLLHTLPISGIFDMRWRRQQPACLLAACADGKLHIVSIQQTESTCHATKLHEVCVSEGTMAVSLDIAPSEQSVVVSLSSGALSSLQVQLNITAGAGLYIHFRS